jgi:hypothetical protein
MSSLEFTHAGQNYKAGKLDVFAQFHVTRRLGPLLPELVGVAKGLKDDSDTMAVLEPLARIAASMKDADVEYVLHNCLAVVSRQQPGGAWAKVQSSPGVLMFEDIDMAAMLGIVWHVLRHSLSRFFVETPQASSGEDRT